jgi:pimeloyl-ACP methyl ester carboxylesterase
MNRHIAFGVALAGAVMLGGVLNGPAAHAAAQASARPQPSGAETIRPFKINIPDADLADLKQRLSRARMPDEIEGIGWDQGTSRAYLTELVTYWRDRFDWRAQERRLNRFDQFKTTIDGIEIHFVHVRSREPNALPLIITHGWPGSFVEFDKVIERLTDPVKFGGRASDAFNVVVPSIPGFGFSERPHERGYNPGKIAGVFAKLMARLGYARYAAQGGDFGSAITRAMAQQDAAHMVGLHLNFCIGGAPQGVADPNAGLTQEEIAKIKGGLFAKGDEQAYSQQMGTRPQTIGYALNDSPVGLAAWIVEKFRVWSDNGGDVEKSFTKDEMLTNISLYWLTQTAASSARIYYEARNAGPADTRRIEVPTACAIFPKEVAYAPRAWQATRMNLVRWTEMPRGGHFAALEQPELLANDVTEFFRGLRGAAGSR